MSKTYCLKYLTNMPWVDYFAYSDGEVAFIEIVRKFIENNLKLLPINKESNLAIDLIKILLLSNAAAPEFKEGTDLILIRINKLIELGDFDNAKLTRKLCGENFSILSVMVYEGGTLPPLVKPSVGVKDDASISFAEAKFPQSVAAPEV